MKNNNFIGDKVTSSIQICNRIVAPSRRKACIEILEAQGYYKFARDLTWEASQSQFVLTGNVNDDLFSDDTNRVCFIDCENVAEGTIIPLIIEEVNPLLVRRDITLTSISEGWTGVSQDEYWLQLNNFKAILWKLEELAVSQDDWLLAGDRFIKFINAFLTFMGIDEQFYYHFSGNDTLTVLLTNRMHETLSKIGAISEGICSG